MKIGGQTFYRKNYRNNPLYYSPVPVYETQWFPLAHNSCHNRVSSFLLSPYLIPEQPFTHGFMPSSMIPPFTWTPASPGFPPPSMAVPSASSSWLGMLRGPGLGALLFTTNTHPQGKLIQSHGFKYCMFMIPKMLKSSLDHLPYFQTHEPVLYFLLEV